MPVRRAVSAVRRRRKKNLRRQEPFHDDCFAFTNRGVVLLNVMNFDGVTTPEEALKRAKAEGTPIFIGVALETAEVRSVVRHIAELLHEPAATVIGSRQRAAMRTSGR